MKIDVTLYGITDGKWTNRLPLEQQVEQAIQGGVTVIQYREKTKGYEKRREEAARVQDVCKKYQVPFLIDDDVTLAKEIDADGVHLGQGDMELAQARQILGADKLIGITAKTVEQARAAEAGGADYLGSGAVFGTSTKLDAIPMKHDLLDEICESVSIPVVAIGGISKDNMGELKGRKMSGFALVSGIFGSADIKSATEELRILAEDALAENR